MPDRFRSEVRNKPLRLTLSGHERQFIDEGRARALRSIKILTALILISVFVIVVANSHYDGRDYATNPILAEEKMVDGKLTYVVKHDTAMTYFYVFLGVMLVAAVVGFVAALRLVFAVVDLFRFRAYRENQEKLLKRYRRRA